MKKIFVVLMVLAVIAGIMTVRYDAAEERRIALQEEELKIAEVVLETHQTAIGNIKQYISVVNGKIKFPDFENEIREIEQEAGRLEQLAGYCERLEGAEKIECVRDLKAPVIEMVSRWNKFLSDYAQKLEKEKNIKEMRRGRLKPSPFLISI